MQHSSFHSRLRSFIFSFFFTSLRYFHSCTVPSTVPRIVYYAVDKERLSAARPLQFLYISFMYDFFVSFPFRSQLLYSHSLDLTMLLFLRLTYAIIYLASSRVTILSLQYYLYIIYSLESWCCDTVVEKLLPWARY